MRKLKSKSKKEIKSSTIKLKNTSALTELAEVLMDDTEREETSYAPGLKEHEEVYHE